MASRRRYAAPLRNASPAGNPSGDRRLLWTAANKAWWNGPDDPHIRLITVDPADAELWKGPNRLVAGAKLLAAVTGAKVGFGETLKVGQI